MKDYEQLYYDQQYKIKQLENENNLLRQELDIYKSISKNKNIKEIIVKDLIKYINKNK